MNAYLSFAPLPGGGQTNANKGVGGDGGVVIGPGWDVVLTHNALVDGLNLFAGTSTVEQNATLGDLDSEAYGFTFAIGGATIGYQTSEMDNVGASGTFYDTDAYAVSYSVNDDLSISYGVAESQSNSGSTGDVEAQSFQVSYSVGGASIVFAESAVDNQNYVSGTNRSGRTVAVTLAF